MHIEPVGPGTVVPVRERNQYHTARPLEILTLFAQENSTHIRIKKSLLFEQALFHFELIQLLSAVRC